MGVRVKHTHVCARANKQGERRKTKHAPKTDTHVHTFHKFGGPISSKRLMKKLFQREVPLHAHPMALQLRGLLLMLCMVHARGNRTGRADKVRL